MEGIIKITKILDLAPKDAYKTQLQRMIMPDDYDQPFCIGSAELPPKWIQYGPIAC